MAYGSALVDTIQSSTTGTPVQFNDGSGTQIGTLCRAWVNFNGNSGSVAIRASFNVTSVTRISTGTYSFSFTNSLTDANYSVVGDCGTGASNNYNVSTNYSSANTTTTCYVGTFNAAGSVDATYISVAIFR